MLTKALMTTLCLATLVFAQTDTPLNVKPGLWQVEMTFTYSGLPPEVQANLDRITPEQRAKLGMGGTKTYKSCVTEKQRNTPWVQGDENCKWTVLNSTSSDLNVRGTACQAGRNEGLSTEVEVKIHAIDSEHVRATLHGTGIGNGIHATVNGSYSGKWMGANCSAE